MPEQDAHLGRLVAARAVQRPDHTFLRFESEQLTYGELHTRSNRLANALIERGLGKAESVAVMLANGPAAVEVWVGLAKAGLIEVPLHASLRGDSLVYQLNQARCRGLVIAGGLLPRLRAVEHRLDSLAEVVVVGDAAEAGLARIPTSSYETIQLTSADEVPDVTVLPSDRSVVMFTSGTTGPPKGVVLTHGSNFALARGVGEIMGYTASDVLFTAFPLSHVNARYTTTLDAMLIDARVVMHQRFSASRFWDLCRREGITAFNYLGGLPTLLLKQPARADDADHPVTRAYGAGASDEIATGFEDRFGVRLVEVFGSTEMGMVCHNSFAHRGRGSCGRPNPDYHVEIHDADDRPVAPGTPGEVVVRPRRPGLMFEGYFENPQATVEAFRELWFHTGDRCVADADGYFSFVDRLKDVIRRRGENISAWEVEQALEAHPAVTEAAAIGVPSPIGDEEVLAIVVAGEVTAAVLLDHCQERLPHYAIPRYVKFVPALPRNASQRVEKTKLREQGLGDDAWDREAEGYRVTR